MSPFVSSRAFAQSPAESWVGAPSLQGLPALRFWAAETVALLPLLAVLLLNLGHPLQDLNEGLYARIPQEMLETGNWIVPMLNGVPYLEKPPFMYWVTAAAYAVFGASEASARTAPVIGVVLLLSAVYWLARRHLRGHTPLLALWMLASTPIMIVLGRTVLFEALFAGLLSWSLVCLYEYWRDSRQRHWIRWSYVCLALAVLTKGFAGIVLFALIGIAAAFTYGLSGGWQRLRALADPIAVALFLVITVPWHVAAAVEQPGFAMFYIVNEHILRYLGQRVPRDYHGGPWWYYLPRLAVYTFPWPLLLVLRRKSPQTMQESTGALRWFLWCWLLVPLVVFSLSEAKGEYYLLIATPPLILFLAQRLSALRGQRALVVVPIAWLVTLAILRIRMFWPYRPPEDAGILLATAVLFACVSIGAFFVRKHALAVIATGAIALPAALLFSGFFTANEEFKSTKTLAQFIRTHEIEELYIYRDFETLSSLPFYLDAPVGIVASLSSDLMYGMHLKPDSQRFPSATQFSATAARRPVWLIVERKRWPEFAQSPLAKQFLVQREEGHHVLLVSTRALVAQAE